MNDKQKPSDLELIIDGFINVIEWTVLVPGAVEIDRDKQATAKSSFAEAMNMWANEKIITELNEARKWSTKADTADQVWQQLTDRINQLNGSK